VHRDTIHQTIIEAFLRDEQLIEAKLLLCERVSLTPNDSQSWRRLASIFGRLNQKDLSNTAHYTAWQLGIGQGGYGGPK
jgi:Flp pilus assembly protein TadD